MKEGGSSDFEFARRCWPIPKLIGMARDGSRVDALLSVAVTGNEGTGGCGGQVLEWYGGQE
jgi:hypothetical protein